MDDWLAGWMTGQLDGCLSALLVGQVDIYTDRQAVAYVTTWKFYNNTNTQPVPEEKQMDRQANGQI